MISLLGDYSNSTFLGELFSVKQEETFYSDFLLFLLIPNHEWKPEKKSSQIIQDGN